MQLGAELPMVIEAVASAPGPKPSSAVTRTCQTSPFAVSVAGTVGVVTSAKVSPLNQR